MVSVASKGRSHGDRLFEELEFERKVKKRKTRLIAATEDAFTHIKRMRKDQQPSTKAICAGSQTPNFSPIYRLGGVSARVGSVYRLTGYDGYRNVTS